MPKGDTSYRPMNNDGIENKYKNIQGQRKRKEGAMIDKKKVQMFQNTGDKSKLSLPGLRSSKDKTLKR